MTKQQFETAVNTVGYAVLASPCYRTSGHSVLDLPPLDDGQVNQPFRWDREATYDEVCAYTGAAFGCDTKTQTEEEWKSAWRLRDPGWIPYIIRTD